MISFYEWSLWYSLLICYEGSTINRVSNVSTFVKCRGKDIKWRLFVFSWLNIISSCVATARKTINESPGINRSSDKTTIQVVSLAITRCRLVLSKNRRDLRCFFDAFSLVSRDHRVTETGNIRPRLSIIFFFSKNSYQHAGRKLHHLTLKSTDFLWSFKIRMICILQIAHRVSRSFFRTRFEQLPSYNKGYLENCFWLSLNMLSKPFTLISIYI